MTYVVATLFDHPDKANEGMHALERSGFNANDIKCIESNPEKQSFFKRVFSSDDSEELQAEKTMDFMTGMGIPKDEAEDYAQKVKKGQSLLLVNTESNGEAERARDLLDRYPFEGAEEERREEPEGTTEEYIEGDLSAHPAGEEYHEGVGKERLQPEDELVDTGDDRVAASEKEHIEGEERIAAAEEELVVGKREEETGGIRAEKEVSEVPVEEDVELREEHVDVERRPTDRPLDEDEAAFTDETIEVSETREEAVAKKEPHVREEVVISKETDAHTETIQDTVLREDINIEDMAQRSTNRFEQFEPELRSHYHENYGDTGESFEDYSVGYRYGMAMAEDEDYRSHNWEDVESDAGRQWESQQAGSWDNFKEAVRFGWYKIRGDEEEYQRRPPQG